MRRWRGGTGVLARGYYKGGFEPQINRREAALILELPYVLPLIDRIYKLD
jgi:DnaJ family protein C protein 19